MVLSISVFAQGTDGAPVTSGGFSLSKFLVPFTGLIVTFAVTFLKRWSWIEANPKWTALIINVLLLALQVGAGWKGHELDFQLLADLIVQVSVSIGLGHEIIVKSLQGRT
jgi:hypothetical protein